MIYHGDLFDVLPTLPPDSVDACITDSPYELGFMAKSWDKSGIAYRPDTWRTIARVLKPGAYLLSFGGTRTFHRITCAIEDAGFEIRDCLMWLYGSGFPKSLNLSDGRGTALKPAWEPIVLARKPFKGSVTANVQRHGTGALNIDACRIETDRSREREYDKEASSGITGSDNRQSAFSLGYTPRNDSWLEFGRWPANVVIDDLAAMVLDEMSGELGGGAYAGPSARPREAHKLNASDGMSNAPDNYGDIGGASRFYYCAKPSREERDLGCDDLPPRMTDTTVERDPDSAGVQNARAGAGRGAGVPIYECAKCGLNLQGGRAVTPCDDGTTHERVVVGYGSPVRNFHPTVKPLALMRWLVRLITPPGGTVIDPFLGSGTTGMACVLEQREFIGVERDADYIEIAKRRIAATAPLFTDATVTRIPKSAVESEASQSLLF